METSEHVKKKVLFLITKSNWGGAQRYVYDLASNLDQQTFEPVVALGGEGELVQKLKSAGIKTITLASAQRDISLFKELRFAKELWSLLRTERPDVLHVNSSKAGGLGCFIGRLAFVPKVVFTAHGWAFNEDRPAWQKPIITFLHWLTVFLSHTTIAVSQEIKRQLSLLFISSRWTVIHNGRHPIDFYSTEVAKEHLGITPNSHLITGTIGELHPVKQHDVMIRAVTQLISNGLNIHHVIISAGEQEAELRELTTQLGMDTHITFAGAVDEAARYLKAFDIYIQPSRSEALGYTVIEATQAGLPIIVSDVGGLPEIIQNNHNGLLVESGNVDDLADAIKQLSEDSELCEQFATEARQTSQQFTFSQMLKKTTAVYLTDSSTTTSSS